MTTRATENIFRPVPSRVSRIHKFLRVMTADKPSGLYKNTAAFAHDGVSLYEHRIEGQQLNGVCNSLLEGTRFIIAHDWEKAFAASNIHIAPNDEWRIPAPRAIFEFELVNDTPDPEAAPKYYAALLILDERDEAPGPNACGIVLMVLPDYTQRAFVQIENPTLGPTLEDCVARFVNSPQDPEARDERRRFIAFVRAGCIAVDMDVTEIEDVIPPPKLNKARERRGKVPLLPYRIINLTRRQRERAKAYAAGQGKPTRLHAVVGHWWPRKDNTESRFDEHRHWRKWRLRGDPDLGFIEHRYKI